MQLGIGIGVYFGIAALCNFVVKKIKDSKSSWLWLFWPVMLAVLLMMLFFYVFISIVNWVGDEFIKIFRLDNDRWLP